MKKSFFCKKNNEAQLLLIGGILVTFLIIVMSSISISIPEINKPVYKTDFIRQEYANIREEFGHALYDRLNDSIDDIEDTSDDETTILLPNFNYITEMFIFVAKSDGNYFSAEYTGRIFDSGSFVGLNATLSFGNEKEFISEDVTYVFT